MSFQKIDPRAKHIVGRRVLITGPPNHGKTASLRTWPRPIHIVNYPGEKGFDTIDAGAPGVTVWVWTIEDPGKFTPASTVAEIERTTWEVLAGVHGECVTFAGDGLHKLYSVYYARARQSLEGSSLSDDVKDARAYGIAHDDFSLYLTRVAQSAIPYAVFTCWDGREPDNPELKGKSSAHVFPDLPGRMAKRIMGEFPVALYAEKGVIVPGQSPKYTWQLQPGGLVWGAGVKLPPDRAATLPAKVPQDFTKLEPLLLGVTGGPDDRQ